MSGASGAHRDHAPHQRRRSLRMFLITSDLKVQDHLEEPIRLEQGHMCLEMPESVGRLEVWVKVIDNGLMVKIERHFLMEVPSDLCGLLEPVTHPGTRFNLLLHDLGKLQQLAAVPLGARLWAQIGQPDELAEAELRHRGTVTRGSSCVLFGVELKGSAVGRGVSNGSYKGYQLFNCPEASALFLPVSHIHLRQWSDERVRGEPRESRRSDPSGDRVREPRESRRSDGNGYPANNNHSQQSQNQNPPQPPAGRSPQHRSALQPLNRTADSVSITAQSPAQGPAGSFQARGGPGSPPLFREGDRVCFPLEHTVQGGEVRYCGTLPGRISNNIFVGILLDAPEGNWDGFYRGDKICHMPSPLYGVLLPIAKVSHESKARQINPRLVVQLPPIPKPSPMSPQHVPKPSPATSPQHVPKPSPPSPHVPVNLRVALMPPQLGSPQLAAQRHALKAPPPPLPPPKPAALAPPPLPPPKPQATPPTMTTDHHHNHHHQSRPSNGTHGPPPPSSPLHSPAGNGGHFPEENGGGDDLEVGSMVEVNDPPLFGVIRWIGRIGGVPELVAGIELDSELSAGTDGSYLGERHFRCPVNKGLFVKLRNCRRDSRFPAPETRVNQVERCNSIAFAEWGSERVEEHTPPMEEEEEVREVFCGWKRGIQGHLNSCYLDSTLFSLFSCCSAADWVLLYPMAEEDGLSSQAQDLLRCEIVNPLRRFGYVCASKTMALRRLLEADSTSDTGFTNQEKDPEEFLTRLFQLLQIEPLLKIRSTNQQPQEFHLYQLFPPPLPPSPPSPVSPPSSPLSPAPLPSPSAGGRLRVASVQTLLESSFHHAGLKFVEAPSCLLLLMPRFGRDFKMFEAILPSLSLDITDLLEDTLRQCSICQSVAEWECLQCYEDLDITPGHLKQYCHTCNTQVHSHRKRVSHAPQRVGVPEGPWAWPGPLCDARQRMALFAVTCIETSHYVSFVKHGPRPSDWLFFDSMADREGGENGFNVPQVRACPEVGRYLSLSEEELSRVDPASLREPARRLLCDAHMCFYHSPELSLYK